MSGIDPSKDQVRATVSGKDFGRDLVEVLNRLREIDPNTVDSIRDRSVPDRDNDRRAAERLWVGLRQSLEGIDDIEEVEELGISIKLRRQRVRLANPIR